ncbi:hypothetical protein Ancab_000491 [Ancistrocladus abbreviatus]
MDFSAGNRLPPGFRFHPTDVELIVFYLKRKVLGKKLSPEVIAVVDIYKFAPWDLPDKSCLRSNDLNWYFFCPRGKKYSGGERMNRATEFGYWKSTGNDRTVSYKERPVGKIKTLIFHRGKPPKGDRTDWVIHEYRLDDKNLAGDGVVQDAYVLCKVFEKSGLGPKNGEQYGAPFIEEEWEYGEEISSIAALPTIEGGASAASNSPGIVASDAQVNGSLPLDGITTSEDPVNMTLILNEDDYDLEEMLAMLVDETCTDLGGSDVYQGLDDLNDWKEFMDGGFQTSQSKYSASFLELRDFEDPL